MIPILALICLLVIIYTILYYKINAKAVFAIKAATSFCFVVLGFYAREKSGDAAGNYPALVISGLLAGLLGDIVLGIRRIDAKRKTTYFIFGSALFFCRSHFLRDGFSYLLRFQTVSLFTNRNRYGRFNYYNNEFKRRQMR